MMLIGSRAMKFRFPDAREPTGDWDWLAAWEPAYFPKWTDLLPTEGAKHDTFVDKRLADWTLGTVPCVATPSELYTIKISHSFWELHGTWNKHAYDILFLKDHGAQFIRPLYEILLPIWKEKHKPNKVRLNKNAGAFFADAVHRKYDHDSLHESVAYGDEPLYMAILKDGAEVAVDNDKFWAMAYDAQLKVVREEIYATALERILIPNDYKGSPGAAYWWALRRTATSLFKGEWALFLMLNLDRLRQPDCDYVGRHLDNKHKLRLDNKHKLLEDT